MALHEDIQSAIQEEKKQSRFQGTLHVESKEVLLDPNRRTINDLSFQGWIQPPKFEIIHVEYKPSFEQKKPGKTLPTAKGIGRHEIIHKGDARLEELVLQGRLGATGCPMTQEHHLAIWEEIRKVLKQQKFSQKDTHYVVNIFEDWIDNSLHGKLPEGIDGLMNFYQELGEVKGDYGEFFEAYLKLQGMFLPVRASKEIRRFYQQRKKEVNKTLTTFLERSGLDKYKKEILEGTTKKYVRDKDAMLKYASTPSNWKTLAKIFAEEFSKLMTPGYAQPAPGMSGEGTKGRETTGMPTDEEEDDGETGEEQEDEDYMDDGDIDEEDEDGDTLIILDDKTLEEMADDGIDWEDLDGGNAFDEEMKNLDKRKEEAWKRYSSGKGRPWWMKYDEAMATIYERLSRRLNIHSDVGKKTLEMPLAWYNPEDIKEGKRMRHLTVRLGPDGKPVIKSKQLNIAMNEEYDAGEEGFPEVRFAYIDSSESTEHAPGCSGGCGGKCKGLTKYIPWGDKSVYHYQCLGFEGFVEFLRSKKLHARTLVTLGDFSNTSRIGHGLKSARRILYSPQFQGTTMSKKAVAEIFKGHGALIFTESDGQIQNWSDVRDDVLRGAKNHYYFHIQIGPHTTMSQELLDEGIPVYTVRGDTDLFNTMFTIGNEMYKPKKKKKYDALGKEARGE